MQAACLEATTSYGKFSSARGFIETAQEAADVCRDDGVAFISHQWAGFEHPDPDGVQYRSLEIGRSQRRRLPQEHGHCCERGPFQRFLVIFIALSLIRIRC